MSSRESDVHSKKVCLLGGKKSGKSKLMKAMTTPKAPYEDKYYATVGIDLGMTSGDGLKLKIWDIPGAEIETRSKPAYFKDSDAFIVTVDLTQPKAKAFKEAKAWIVAARKSCPDTPIIIAGTKSDKPESQVTSEELGAFSTEHGIDHFLITTAKEKVSVHELTTHLYHLLGDQSIAASHDSTATEEEIQSFKEKLTHYETQFGELWSDSDIYQSVIRVLRNYIKDYGVVDTFFTTGLLKEVNMSKLQEIVENMEKNIAPKKGELCDYFNQISLLDKVPNSHLDEHLFYIHEKLRPHLGQGLFSTLIEPASSKPLGPSPGLPK